MIQETITRICRACKSTNIIKNGTNRCGTPQYHCKDCGTYRVLQLKTVYSEAEKQTVLQSCQERSSLRGVQRVFGVARQTIAQWMKMHVQKLPEIKDILLAATPYDVLELDDIWSVGTIRLSQRVGRYVRQTLSFSKDDLHHYLFTKSFIIQYNLDLSLTT